MEAMVGSGREEGTANESSATSGSAEIQTPAAVKASASKLDSLPRVDLIRLVKKQLLNLKETRNQLDAARKQIDERQQLSTGEGGAGADDEFLRMELEDYKSAMNVLKKELSELHKETAKKDALLEELSQRIAQMHQEKEEEHSDLRSKISECEQLRQTAEERSRQIAESAKELDSLNVQLNESRHSRLEEVQLLQEEVRKIGQRLTAEQRSASMKSAELRRLTGDNEMLTQRQTSLQSEFQTYKERAECALARSSAAAVSGAKSANPVAEVQQLIEAINNRNAEVAQMSAKCSFLDEEVRSGQAHAKTLMEEINALNDQMAAQRQQWMSERQKLIADHEQRLRGEESLRSELQRELKTANERELAAVAAAKVGAGQMGEEMDRLRRECDRLVRELEETKAKQKEVGTSPRTRHRPTRPLKMPPPPINLDQRPDLFFAQMLPEEDQLDGRNSESSESDDLQSILQEALQGNSESDLRSFNIAETVRSDDDAGTLASYRVRRDSVVGRDQFVELSKQLADCRELLSETEESNVRLSEQIAVLKEEIRRMERCEKRVEHLGNGLGSEYFKNIVLKFLAPPKVVDERIQLLPVLQTMLHLNGAELDQVRQHCIQSPDSSSPANEVDAAAATEWGSWLGWK